MAVSDTEAGRVIATPAIGKGPDGAAFSQNIKLAFSPNGQDGTLTVVREDSPKMFSVVQTVPTQVSARTMAMDPKTHNIYLAAARYAPAPAAPSTGENAPRQRRSIEPGSFVILVFAP